jgi:alginate O-acetyltransferase complex protein AlgI
MPFNSSLYLVFLVVAVAIFWLLPPVARRVFVLVASLTFYASCGIVFVWLPLLVAGIVYFCGRRIESRQPKARLWAIVGTTWLLALLANFKYAGFVIANFSSVLSWMGVHHLSRAASIVFPIGISFYTFEAIGYLIDVRQGRVKMPSFLDLCLFFLFWPNILSGPIVRARELVPQLAFRKPFEPQFIFDGCDRLLWGLVQKTAIANTLGTWVDRGFVSSAKFPSTLDSWFLAVAFALQIYFDFAGYTNMAIGTARLLGVALPENFRYPYHAMNPPDFWARWHMTLSRWIRDYLFFPINARWKGAPVPLYLSLLGVMALVGLWHGAGWNFVLWGFLHGAYLAIYRMYESWKNVRPGMATSIALAAFWRVATLVAVLVAWVVFRATDLATAGPIVSGMFYRFSAGASYARMIYLFTLAAVFFCAVEPMVMGHLAQIEDQPSTETVSPFRVVVRPLAYLFCLFVFLLFDSNNAQFIYSQF